MSSGTRKSKSSSESTIKEWLKAIIFSVLFVVTFRGVVAQAYQIPTGSMENTLLVGDYLFINKMLYGSEIDLGISGHQLLHYRFPAFRQPHPGDVIVFRYPENIHQDFIKRCVAVGGQTVMIRNKTLYVDGVQQVEPYVIHIDPRILPREVSQRDNFGPITVPKGYLFMMGDNRDNSHDSRFWGPLAVGLIKGKAMIRYFSWDGEHSSIRFNRMFQPIG
ncbi:MAG TPA: signal peptidase I [Candidatus Dormibacteraeota bacterium]|nr:signal peptidase I [Candidatus Dormibacteraeota bacterium]